MKKEKKELIKNFKVVIEDLMDNYEEYTDEEKAQVKEVFQKVAELNKILDKYDIDKKIDWAQYLEVYALYFNPMYMRRKENTLRNKTVQRISPRNTLAQAEICI